MTDSLSDKTLEPCPFCGSQPFEKRWGDREDQSGEVEDGFYEVACRTCTGGAGGRFCGVHAPSREKAIAAWNTRTPPPPGRVPREDDERDRFELWAEADNQNLAALEFEERTADNGCYYESEFTNGAYMGWRARSALFPAAPLADEPLASATWGDGELWVKCDGDEITVTRGSHAICLSLADWHRVGSAHLNSPAPASQGDRVAALEEALRPFGACAEHDIGQSEDDADTFRNTDYNRAPKITVGDLRRALAALSDVGGGDKEGFGSDRCLGSSSDAHPSVRPDTGAE